MIWLIIVLGVVFAASLCYMIYCINSLNDRFIFPTTVLVIVSFCFLLGFGLAWSTASTENELVLKSYDQTKILIMSNNYKILPLENKINILAMMNKINTAIKQHREYFTRENRPLILDNLYNRGILKLELLVMEE